MVEREEVQWYLEQLIKILKLDHWDIIYSIVDYTYADDSIARAKVDHSYYNAEITLNIETIKTTDELLSTLIHELCHLLQEPFFSFIDLVESSILQNVEVQSVLIKAWSSALEKNNVVITRLIENGIKSQLKPYKKEVIVKKKKKNDK